MDMVLALASRRALALIPTISTNNAPADQHLAEQQAIIVNLEEALQPCFFEPPTHLMKSSRKVRLKSCETTLMAILANKATEAAK